MSSETDTLRYAGAFGPLARAAEAGQSFALAQLLRWTWRPASDLVGGRGDFRVLRTALELGTRLVPPRNGIAHEAVRITDPHRDGHLPAEWSVPQNATEAHLKHLAAIAEMFSDEGFCKKLREAADDAALFQLINNFKPGN